MNNRLSVWWPSSPVGQVFLSIILVLTFIAPSFHTLPNGVMLFAPDLIAGILGTLTLYLLVVLARRFTVARQSDGAISNAWGRLQPSDRKVLIRSVVALIALIVFLYLLG